MLRPRRDDHVFRSAFLIEHMGTVPYFRFERDSAAEFSLKTRKRTVEAEMLESSEFGHSSPDPALI